MGVLELRGIGLRYGDVVALDGIDLDVAAGSRLAIVGPSGSGKSSLLRVLAGFEAPDRGQVRLDGTLLADGPAIVPPHRRAIGLVAQEGALFPHLSVAENIGFGVSKRDRGRGAAIDELARLVGLDAAMLRRKPDALSGGQQQRVALARALACRPRLMLLDEPFSALDTGLRAETRHAVAALLAKTGITTVLVTHDQEEALSFADQVAVLQAGRLLQAGAPRDLYLRPCSEQVASFLGPAIILPATLAEGRAQCALGLVETDAVGEGAVRIMLRPEQVGLLPPGGSAGVACTVQEVEFAGGSCSVVLRLADGTVLALRAAQSTVPPEGTAARLVVSGKAHLF